MALAGPEKAVCLWVNTTTVNNCHETHGGGKQLLYPVDLLGKKFLLSISSTIASVTYMPLALAFVLPRLFIGLTSL